MTTATLPLVTSPVAIFLVVLAIILLTPLLLNRLKIPTIIGMIVAGVIVGPYGLHVLDRDMSFEVFGQVGILYLMFLAGLEIDMYHLKRNLHRGLTFGIYTFLIPLGAGFLASRYLLGLDTLGSMLAATIFSSHTLIGYPLVSRFGLTKQPAVIIAIAGTIVTVLLSLIVLASVAGVYREGELRIGSVLALLGALVLFCGGILLVYPRLTQWFFKKNLDPIVQFVYVLSLVFVAAVIAAGIGIEGVFGAFFAGLVLNRYIPARSSLMARIEFVGNAIFIPYFLIGVGMMINIGVLTSGIGTLYVAAVITAVAMAAKWLSALLAQVTFGMGRIERSIMYQLSNAHTAVALAVVMIGYNLGVLTDDILNGTILMILLTCTVASIGVGRSARKLSILIHHRRSEEAPGGTSGHPTCHTLIPLANPQMAPQLVSLAVLMRGTPGRDSKLYALNVRNDNSPGKKNRSRNSLDIAHRAAIATDSQLTTIERFDINVVTGIVNTIAERDISIIILGLHRRSGMIDSFFGSKIEQLLRSTLRMVVISRIFIPLNTVRRINVVLPAKAHIESGFPLWLDCVANLTRQVGCRVTFIGSHDTLAAINALIVKGKYGISFTLREAPAPDHYVLLAGETGPDDLTVFIMARPTAVSYAPWLDDVPAFLYRNMAQSNLIMIYPEQSGETPSTDTITHGMATEIYADQTHLWKRLTRIFHRL